MHLILNFFLPAVAKAQGIVIPDNTGLPGPNGGIQAILLNFTNWILTIFVILAVIAFVVTGIMYLVAMGDSRSQTLENAKQYFKHAVIALLVVGSSYIIIMTINMILTT